MMCMAPGRRRNTPHPDAAASNLIWDFRHSEPPNAAVCSDWRVSRPSPTHSASGDGTHLHRRWTVNEQQPLPVWTAIVGELRCVGRTAVLLAQRRLHLPKAFVGQPIHFADGGHATVFRETTVDRGATLDPAVLVVAFRLRLIRGRGHAFFRRESLLNTPLFAGFPGLVSKLWISHDGKGNYRGLYEWDGPELAERYARSLWRVLAIGSVRGSIRYHVAAGLRREDVLSRPGMVNDLEGSDWWVPVAMGNRVA